MKSLTSLLSRKEGPLVGLDISSSSVKLVELSRARNGIYTLEHCGIEPLEVGWVEDGSIENFDAVSATVNRLVRASGTKAKSAALALPPSAVITKKILLSSELNEEDMEMQIEAEASQYIPFPIDEVSLDFFVIGPPAGSDGSEVEVLLAASRKERVEDRQAIAEELGLKAEIIDVDVFAARLAAARPIEMLGLGRESVVALFEIGGKSTTLQILQGNDAVYERELGFGGLQLTEAMAKQYGFTTQEAEMKKRQGSVPSDFDTTLVPEFVENIAGEVARALQLFLSSTVYGRVDHIFLAGGAASVAKLDNQIARQSGSATTVINPFEGMNIGQGVRQRNLDHEAPSYLTACGLAMRRFVG